MPKYVAPKGTHDILPAGRDRSSWVEDIAKWHWFEGVVRDVARLYGYEEVRTPAFEQTDLFHRAVGEGTDIVTKEMYDFATKADKDGKSDHYTLRPEGTAPALRAYVENRLYIDKPVNKLYYLSSIFRYERPTKGRYRQHHQFGVEALGAGGPEIDAEVINLAVTFFRRLGIARLTLKINSVGTVESRGRYIAALREFAEPFLADMSDDNRRRYETNALRMLDSKSERDQQILASAPLLSDFLDDESRSHHDTLLGYLDDLGVTYEADPRLVRGFDYYVKTAFEVQSPDVGAQSALAGGGRYDRLVESIGGPPTPGIGFGLGIERTLLALETLKASVPQSAGPTAFLCPIGDAARKACVPLLAELRGAGISADVDYTGRRMKGMLEQADAIRARYAVIVGDEELAGGVVNVRDVITKSQEVVPLLTLVDRLSG
ncbi:MAG: histidine--tRNA ligase [Fibrella sp.]|nr:histidine--tRNA ligase [Armatimonadota bacterium]